jgi:hypothetical protein
MNDPARSRSTPGRIRTVTWVTPSLAIAAALALLSVIALSVLTGCDNVRPAVTLKLVKAKEAPRDASVSIDEEYIGPLGIVAARGVRLPLGEHRITVEKDGYFPWDRLVVADREPIKLDVVLVPIPD